jgi:hypothetical protein
MNIKLSNQRIIFYYVETAEFSDEANSFLLMRKQNKMTKKSLTKKLIGAGQKAIIYSGNYLPSVIANNSKLGHPYAVVGNFAMDVISWISPEFRKSSYYRLPKLASAVYFFGKSIYDLGRIAHGNHENGIDLIFDATMAYQMIYDMGQAYQESGKNPAEDLKKVGKGLDNFVNKTIENSKIVLKNMTD